MMPWMHFTINSVLKKMIDYCLTIELCCCGRLDCSFMSLKRRDELTSQEEELSPLRLRNDCAFKMINSLDHYF